MKNLLILFVACFFSFSAMSTNNVVSFNSDAPVLCGDKDKKAETNSDAPVLCGDKDKKAETKKASKKSETADKACCASKAAATSAEVKSCGDKAGVEVKTVGNNSSDKPGCCSSKKAKVENTPQE